MGEQNIPDSVFEPFIKFLNALLFPIKNKTVLTGFADSLRAGIGSRLKERRGEVPRSGAGGNTEQLFIGSVPVTADDFFPPLFLFFNRPGSPFTRPSASMLRFLRASMRAGSAALLLPR